MLLYTRLARRALTHSRRVNCQKTRLRSLHGVTPVIPPSAEDEDLIQLFDRPGGKNLRSDLTATGLFLQPALKTASGFRVLAQSAIDKAQALLNRILRAPSSSSELEKVVKNMDRLSDTLCGVIDLAELVRHTHPDQKWVDSANEAYGMLFEYMNVLNTHVGMFEVLKTVLSHPETKATLSAEALETAHVFRKDFEKSGIHLPPQLRTKFVEMSSKILSLGQDFLSLTSSPPSPTRIPSSWMHPPAPQGKKRIWHQKDITVYPGSSEARSIMKHVSSDAARQAVYLASNSSTTEQIQVLEDLLTSRGRLARLVGKDSYAEMTLEDKMARSPEHVMAFLRSLLSHSLPHVQDFLEQVALRKQTVLGLSSQPDVLAWDTEYFAPPTNSRSLIVPSLTAGSVFFGLSRLFTHLFGISLRPSTVQMGEVWNEDVVKLDVVDEQEGLIGRIYADLFSRPGKLPGAAHYTVRCSRRVDDDDVEGDLESPLFRNPTQELVIPAHRTRGREGLYQLPIVVLVCDFAKPTQKAGAETLDWNEVSTTFHEMGHAIHSMIGRTDYQNVSGTRCATDFVELPSLLMQHFFLTSPDVQSVFKSSASPPKVHVLPAQASALEAHSQIMLATLDQLYHSQLAAKDQFDSTAILADLQNQQGGLQYVPGTAMQTKFGHLYGYGATYYSYILDKALASAVWDRLFKADPLSREQGDKFRHEVLKYGGSKDPWRMLSALLSMPELAEGGAGAMQEVGRWNVEESGLEFPHHQAQ